MTFSKFVYDFQTLLSNPSMENAINLEALKLMRQSPHTYQQLILECVKVSQQIDGINYFFTLSVALLYNYEAVRSVFCEQIKH